MKTFRINIIYERPNPVTTIGTTTTTTTTTTTKLCIDPKLTLTPEQRNVVRSITFQQTQIIPEVIISESIITIVSQDEIKNTFIEITTPDGSEDEISTLSTPSDPRLGATPKTNCSTCAQDYSKCPGHFGYVDLGFYIYHPYYISYIIKVLQSVCNSCGGLLLSSDDIKRLNLDRYNPKDRLWYIAELSRKKICTRSPIIDGKPVICISNPIFQDGESSRTGQIVYKKEPKSPENYIMDIEDVLNILQHIDQKDLELMGFKYGQHPKNFIMRYWPILPPQDRPIVEQDGKIFRDDLTIMYNELLKDVNIYKKSSDPNIREQSKARIIDRIYHIINNTEGKYTQGPDRPLSSIKQRIQTKTGLIRGASMGKRVNFTARTVVSPDPNLRFGQVRIPEIFAKYLTQPVKVNQLNLEFVRDLYRRGKLVSITKGSGELKGRTFYIENDDRRSQTIEIGDIVSREAMNGDYFLVNRQPTLHKYGMMGHEIVLSPHLTIGLHPSVTVAYNADFDGDEMNLHAPQTIEAMVEVRGIMNVKNCVMNVQNNKPVIAAVYDALTGSYLLTQDNTKVDLHIFMDILSSMIEPPDYHEFLERVRRVNPSSIYYDNNSNIIGFSGRTLFSVLLPPDLYYRKGNVIIVDGILISGIITKDHIGISTGSIVQVLWINYGINVTTNFITNIGWLTNRWLDTNPVTVGIQDCLPNDPDLKSKIDKEIHKAILILESYSGIKLNNPIEEEKREQEIIGHLQNTRNNVSELVYKSITDNNRLKVMSLSGAKGTKVNIVQIMGILGQQFLRNQRIPITLGDGYRTLPYFTKDSIDPRARGFAANSFINGLDPAEFFFHQAASREGLLDISTKTPETGDLSHRLGKALEDMMVNYDGTVRNASMDIFQFIYGDDGFDPQELEIYTTNGIRQLSFINIDRTIERLNIKYGYGRGEDVSIVTTELDIIQQIDNINLFDDEEEDQYSAEED
jgi:DNA-directed RNA polymerase beta' subunit